MVSMSNRDFNKKFAIALSALIGGAGALGSMNISTSAMEQEHSRYETMQNSIDKLVEDFKEIYNNRRNENLNDDQEYRLFIRLREKYRTLVHYRQSAFHLAVSAAYSSYKGVLEDDLKTDIKDLINDEKYKEACFIMMLKDNILQRTDINWRTD